MPGGEGGADDGVFPLGERWERCEGAAAAVVAAGDEDVFPGDGCDAMAAGRVDEFYVDGELWVCGFEDED